MQVELERITQSRWIKKAVRIADAVKLEEKYTRINSKIKLILQIQMQHIPS